MLTTKNKHTLIFFLISLATYLIFFGELTNPDITMYSGKDSVNYHYPTMYYLHERLHEGEFPFWTERIFSGYPIYAQVESGYLNPLNITSTYLFGPILANKLLHLSFYLLGSWGLYALLKRRGASLLGFSAANLIYFFSFVILYHQQHFSITKAFYILPLIIYLTDLSISTKRVKHILLTVLALLSALYFGSFQAILIILITQLLYVLSQKPKKLFFIRYYLIYGFFCLVLALPLILPAVELIKDSGRASLSYIEGSFNTLDLANFAYPFTYGAGDDYFGTSLFNDHLKHETYVYFGITTILLALIGYGGSDEKTKRFVGYAVVTTLALSFIRYVPVVSKFFLPPITMFRYWGRFAVVLPFVSALLVSSVLTKDKFRIEFKIKNLRLPILITLITAIVWALNAELLHVLQTLKANFQFDQNFFIWILLILGSLLALRVPFRHKKYALAALLCFDLIFFGKIVTKNDFIDVNTLRAKQDVVENERAHIRSSEYSYNKGLYYENWGYFGYTPLSSKKYRDHLSNLGIESEKRADTSADLSIYNQLIPNNDGYELLSLEQREGSVYATLNVFENIVLETNIRNYKDWKVFDNGNKLSINRETLFIQIPLEEGEHNIKLKFIPTTLYNALVISGLLTLTGSLILYKNKNALNI